MALTTWAGGVVLFATVSAGPPVTAQTPAPAPAEPPAATQQPAPDPAAPAGQQPPPHNPGQEVAGEAAQGQALDIGPAQLRFGGYVGVTGLYRSTNSGGGPGTAFAAIPYEDTLAGSVSETRLTAQSSRLSIRVDAPFPEARFRQMAGYFEMDFSGDTPGNIAVTASSAGFRLRQAFAEAQYGQHFVVAAGQAFTLMTPPKGQLSIWPSDYELSQTVDTNYVTGLVWERVPQVRFTWRPSAIFNWAASIENPEQQIGAGLVSLPACCADDLLAQYNTGNAALRTPNLMPDFVTRIAYNPSPAVHVDVGGVLRAFRHTLAPYDDSVKAVGGGVSANARWNPASRTRLIGQFAHGPGLGRYVGGLAPDVAFRSDGSIAPIPTTSWVAGIEQVVSARFSGAAYYSGLQIDATTFVDANGQAIGFGHEGASNAVNREIQEVTGTVSYLAVRTENRGSVQVNFQTSWLRREPWWQGGGPDVARAFLFFAQVRYNLP